MPLYLCHVLNDVGKVKMPLVIQHCSLKTIDATVHVSVVENTQIGKFLKNNHKWFFIISHFFPTKYQN